MSPPDLKGWLQPRGLVGYGPVARPGWGHVPALAVLFATGGATGLLALVLPTGPGSADIVIAAAGMVALCLAAAMGVSPRALGPWAWHAVIVIGNVLITIGLVAAGPGATIWAPLYVWAPVYTAAYATRPAAAAHLAITVGLHAAALAWVGVPEATIRVVVIAVAGLMAAIVVAALVARISALAGTDALTGLPNRRAFEEALIREHASAVRRGTPLCVAAVDLDDFKAINDRHGHAHGDAVLCAAAAAWSAQLRRSDVLARLGGDEFAVLLPDCTVADALALGRGMLAATPAEVRASLGVASVGADRSPQQLLGAADAALYAAKHGGGNVVTTADDMPRDASEKRRVIASPPSRVAPADRDAQ